MKKKRKPTCPAVWLMCDGLESSSRACFLGKPTSLSGLLIAARRPFQNSCTRKKETKISRKETKTEKVYFVEWQKIFRNTGKRELKNRIHCKDGSQKDALPLASQKKKEKGRQHESRPSPSLPKLDRWTATFVLSHSGGTCILFFTRTIKHASF